MTGILQPSEGSLLLDGRPVTLSSAHDAFVRGITAIHQETVLFDDLTVAENIDLPLSYKDISKAERQGMVADTLDRFNIVGKKDLFPNQLSGGQQQLVGIARAVVNQVLSKLQLVDRLRFDRKGFYVLAHLSPRLMLRTVEKDQLALALKGASDSLRDMFFSNMSERAAKIMREDMETMGPVRLRECQAPWHLRADARFIGRIGQRQRIRPARQQPAKQAVERWRCSGLDHLDHFEDGGGFCHQVSGR